MKQPNGFEIIQLFESISPKSLAMEGDKIGLQIGTLNKPISNVLIALDVLEEVVNEAIEKQAELIIAHHPIIFNPLKTILTDTPWGKVYEKLIKHDIAVYAAHTNLDVAIGGVNDLLAEKLELQNTEVLIPTYEDKLKKLVVYAPIEAEDSIRQAIGDAGGGFIGNYSHCSFTAHGVGRFLPGESTNPHIGKPGQLEAVEEARIETIFSESIEKKVLRAMLKAHPYEEPAYDIYPLNIKGKELGLGRIGYLKEEMKLEQFVQHLKKVLDVQGVRVIGDLNATVKKVAVLGGDGNKYYYHALRKGADVYVTGDMYYHTAIDAKLDGLNIVDPGHNIEKVMKEGVQKVLTNLCQEKKFNVQIHASKIHTDPFQFL